MANYLYFASAAPDATGGTEQVACFPAGQLSHFAMASATALRVYFERLVKKMTLTHGIDAAHVVLTVTTGKHKEAIQDIVCKLSIRPSGGNFGFM